jgi:hypothetical protein
MTESDGSYEVDWDATADGAQTMAEHALGVATDGASEVITNIPGAHEAIHHGLQAAGNAAGDAMYDAVGPEHAAKSAQDFDEGHYLAGAGEMVEGVAGHAEEKVENLANEAWDGLKDLL